MNSKSRILIVDDELPVCKSICGILQDGNSQVDMALSGEEALEKEMKHKYNVIITDLMMPGMTGMNLLKLLRVKRPELPIIVITGYPSIKTAVSAIKLGAFDFIPKPFTPNELRGLVWRALERQSLFDKLKEKTETKRGRQRSEVPKGMYTISEHSWVKVEVNNIARVGAHHVFLRTLKRVLQVELPEVNELLNQGDVCAKIKGTALGGHRVWSPVTGKVVEVNVALQKDCAPLATDPYGAGWLLKVEAHQLDEDLVNLNVT